MLTDLKTLKEFLEKSQHPIMERWTKEEAVPEAEAPSSETQAAPGWSMPSMPAGMPMMPMQFGGGGGVRSLVSRMQRSLLSELCLRKQRNEGALTDLGAICVFCS